MRKIYIAIALIALLTGCGRDTCCEAELEELKSFHNDNNITVARVDNNTTMRVNLDLNDTIHDDDKVDLTNFVCFSGDIVYLKVNENNNSVIDAFLHKYNDYECVTRYKCNGMISIKCEGL